MALPDGVGWTALMTAFARAQENELFEDPWARSVIRRALAEHTGELPRLGPGADGSQLWAALSAYFVTRTLFYDKHVRTGISQGADQLVLLAAGFDGRAHRLGLSAGTTLFEVDTDPVLTFKDAALADELGPGGAGSTLPRVCVRTDLRGDWAPQLVAAGFDPSRPAVWVVEGLLMYLDGDQADRLLDVVSSLAASGSHLVTEWFERNPVGEASLVDWPDEEDRRAGEYVGSLFRAGPGRAPADWLPSHGWEVTATDDVGSFAARLGRDASRLFDPDQPEGLRVHLVAGRRT